MNTNDTQSTVQVAVVQAGSSFLPDNSLACLKGQYRGPTTIWMGAPI